MKDYFINVMALDKDFNVVCALRYTNLQWSRKFFEAGTFSLQIPVEQYTPEMKYIYTKDRPEVGEISQINYMDSNGVKVFALSGYFLEKQLSRRICYIQGTRSNITNSISWGSQTGCAEDVAVAFFEAFKDISFTQDEETVDCELGIDLGTNLSRGDEVESARDGSSLDEKLMSILRPSEMSYRVDYDFANNVKTFHCVKGRDLRQENTELNNPVIFSTRYGNLVNPNIVLSTSDYKNAFTISNEATYTYHIKFQYLDASGNPQTFETDIAVKQTDVRAGSEIKPEDAYDAFLGVAGNVNVDDFKTSQISYNDTAYFQALMAQGKEEMFKHPNTMSFDFTAKEGSYRYMTDFDIGDKCSIEVAEIGISRDAILTECIEVIKAGTWSMTMNFEVQE